MIAAVVLARAIARWKFGSHSKSATCPGLKPNALNFALDRPPGVGAPSLQQVSCISAETVAWLREHNDLTQPALIDAQPLTHPTRRLAVRQTATESIRARFGASRDESRGDNRHRPSAQAARHSIGQAPTHGGRRSSLRPERDFSRLPVMHTSLELWSARWGKADVPRARTSSSAFDPKRSSACLIRKVGERKICLHSDAMPQRNVRGNSRSDSGKFPQQLGNKFLNLGPQATARTMA